MHRSVLAVHCCASLTVGTENIFNSSFDVGEFNFCPLILSHRRTNLFVFLVFAHVAILQHGPVWLIFYQPRRDSVEIVHVMHGARDIESLLDG